MMIRFAVEKIAQAGRRFVHTALMIERQRVVVPRRLPKLCDRI
jgi:hypothetical protein